MEGVFREVNGHVDGGVGLVVVVLPPSKRLAQRSCGGMASE